VVTACLTLVAGVAGNGRIDRYPIARLELPDRRPDRLHNACGFMPNRKWIGHHLTTDAALGVVMHVRAADAHGPNAQQHLVRPPDLRIGDRAQFHLPKTG